MGLYETMIILRPDLETEEQESVLSGFTAVVANHGGEVSTVLDWRKRRLAYEINKYREGHYYLIYFSGAGTIIPELEHYFKVTDAIIRNMVVSVEEKDFAAAAEKAAAAAEAITNAEAETEADVSDGEGVAAEPADDDQVVQELPEESATEAEEVEEEVEVEEVQEEVEEEVEEEVQEEVQEEDISAKPEEPGQDEEDLKTEG